MDDEGEPKPQPEAGDEGDEIYLGIKESLKKAKVGSPKLTAFCDLADMLNATVDMRKYNQNKASWLDHPQSEEQKKALIEAESNVISVATERALIKERINESMSRMPGYGEAFEKFSKEADRLTRAGSYNLTAMNLSGLKSELLGTSRLLYY